MDKKIEYFVIVAKTNARSLICGSETWYTGTDVCRILGFRINQSGIFSELQKIKPGQRRSLPENVGGRRAPVMINEEGIRTLARVAVQRIQTAKETLNAPNVFLYG
ncbi:hypothetical protein [Ochrobactrum sp. AP1BH01-1]|uniref:hypothetical protein n=1 Tax=Ochrobactrum sp. AP1BH01-1 TaxID=2823874 RepID=UPI001B36498E|nr:hypothetical protein [Ochrobactrum sp. AP1BH01-1]MBQ0707441.1 hypothetical protein [Ochrobactrum sp. AP1BH01-1]